MTGGPRSWDSVSSQAMYSELGHFPFLPMGRVLRDRKKVGEKSPRGPLHAAQLVVCFLTSNSA